MSSTAWEALGSPMLLSANGVISAFNRTTNLPLGILSQLLIFLGGKTIFIDVLVVQGPLDFNLFFGRDYIYTMKSIASSLFQVMHFPHDGKIVTID